MIRVVLADDEAPARRKLKRFLASDAEVEIAGEAASGEEALRIIRQMRPDLVFLDVQMPGLDGFGVVEALPEPERPHVVFVTAHDHYACRAFEVHALNYLLKPVEEKRFTEVMQRAKRQIRQGHDLDKELHQKFRALVESLEARQTYSRRLLIDTGKKSLFLAVEEIEWIEAERNYIRIHTRAESHVVRSTIEGFHRKLDPAQFARVSRSQIVNLDAIREMQPWFHGEHRIILKDGTELTWSRRFAPQSVCKD